MSRKIATFKTLGLAALMGSSSASVFAAQIPCKVERSVLYQGVPSYAVGGNTVVSVRSDNPSAIRNPSRASALPSVERRSRPTLTNTRFERPTLSQESPGSLPSNSTNLQGRTSTVVATERHDGLLSSMPCR